MKTKYFLLNKIQYTAFILILIATLLASTNALAADGVLDPTFGVNGVVHDLDGSSLKGINVIVQPDGKIVVASSGGAPRLTRYNLDGTLDTTFGTNGKVTSEMEGPVALQPDGKLIVGDSAGDGFGLVRYTSNGALDTTFGTNGIAVTQGNSNFYYIFGDLAIQPDGKIVVIGTEETGGHHYPGIIVRFNADGTADEGFWGMAFDDGNFPGSFQQYFEAVAFQSDGKIIMSGTAAQWETGPAMILGRLTNEPEPWLDPTFGTSGLGTTVTVFSNFVHGRGAIAIQPDDKIVIAGTAQGDPEGTDDDLAVVRYNSNGTLDTTFGGDGIVVTDLGKAESGNDLAIQRDGKILVAGSSYDRSSSTQNALLVRYNPNGSLDSTFGDQGKVIESLGGDFPSLEGIALQPDGKILVTGREAENTVLARFEGTLPLTTATTFNSKAASDGWILESTEFSNVGGTLNKTATTFYVGDDPKDKQYRSILSFNTAALPDNAFIVSAQVKIKRQGLVGTDPFTTHRNLLLEIRNGLFSNDLDLKLSDFAAAPSSNVADPFAPLTSGWYAANLSSSNLALVNKYGVTQFRLRFDRDDNDDLSADYLKFFTGESTTANQPQLIVTYVLP